MQIFSFHLTETTPFKTLRALCRPPTMHGTAGLKHAECMAVMELGAPILSPSRMQLNKLAVFASWDSECALDTFLAESDLGCTLSAGWHVRLKLLRRWGHFPEFNDPPARDDHSDPTRPVVAVTIARLKIPHVFRFIRWGRPVEMLVRDHPGTSLALAAMRLPRTFSTFSVWRTQQEMTDMVHGQGSTSGATRHADAMKERNRKDFHHSFTTLRFRALSEHGEWAGRKRILENISVRGGHGCTQSETRIQKLTEKPDHELQPCDWAPGSRVEGCGT